LTVSGTVTAAPGTTLLDTASATSTTPDADPGNNDGSSDSSRTSTLVVAAVIPNTPPVAADLTVDGITGGDILGTVTATDAEPDQAVRFTVVSGPANGIIVMLPGGGFAYRGDPAFTGIDTVTFQACDNGTPQGCDQGTLTLNVFPVASDDTAQVFQGQPAVIPIIPDNSTPGAVLV
ncbi:Ig-like domain-containing protein, partial [Paenibacillus sp. TAF58]